MKLSTDALVLTPDSAIDLQLHTIHSDGTWLPEQLIDYAKGEEFGLIAITDHDRVDRLVELQQIAVAKNQPVLVAVEMTTTWQGEMTDILCYGFDPEDNHLSELAQDVLRRQQENTREVYNNLCQKGYLQPQHADEVQAILEHAPAAQPHELVALLKRAGAESSGKFALEAGLSFATNDTAAVVDAAHRSGAVCLIAHPGRDDGFVPFDTNRLDQLRQEVPIDGLEVYYPLHTPEQTALYHQYAQKHGLLTSSGSDSHHPTKPPVKYHAKLSRTLLERLGIEIRG